MSKIKKFLTLFFVFCLIVSLSQSIIAQEKEETAFNPEKKFFVTQLKEDFLVLRNALEEGHGGLYRYTSKEELDKQFEEILGSLEQPMTEMEFYRKLLPLIANINDGHSGVTLSRDYNKYLGDKPLLFPFNLRFIDKKAYLFRNYSEAEGVEMGGELISINGKPISEIVGKMLPRIPSDAHIQTSKYRRLESTASFGTLYISMFGRTNTYSITYKPRDTGEIKTLTVKGIMFKDLNAIFEERYPEAAKTKPPIELEYKEGIPILTIRTFGSSGYKRAKIAYATFMKEAFKEFEAKGVKNLIVDLRDNGGGDDVYGKILFAYLTDKPFQYYKHLRVKKKKFSFMKYTSTPQRKQEIPDSRFHANEEGTYDFLGHPNLGQQKPIQPTFKGNTYILINGRSFSATGETTSVIHFHKKAVFIGEECGAGYYGNTSGRGAVLVLPNTKIRTRIPFVRYTMAVSGYPKDRGLIPDYPVSPTIKDLLADRDTVMNFTIDLIKKNK